MTKTKTLIHQTAIIETGAELGDQVEIGPYCTIGPHVTIGDKVKIGPRVSVEGWTSIGPGCQIFSGAIVGSPTQDKKFKGGKTFLRIGSENIIREYVTINPGTDEGTETVIGDQNLLMAYSHVAHDCVLGNNITLANAATLAGHVSVDDRSVVGGLTAIHQFVRVGVLAIIGGCSKVVQDVPPYMMSDGHPARTFGINSIGLERANVSKEDRMQLKRAYKILFRAGLSIKNAVAKVESDIEMTPTIVTLLDFIRNSERGIC